MKNIIKLCVTFFGSPHGVFKTFWNIFTPKIIIAILLVSVSASWAVSNNSSILPAIFLLLLDEDSPSFPDQLDILVGDDLYIPAFTGKDINSNVLIYDGITDVTDQFEFSLASGPTGLVIDQTGLISFTATSASTLGRNTIEVEIIEKSTGAVKTISFVVFVMQTEVIATGNIGPAGGTVQNDWQDVVLHIPADAVTVLSTFNVLRGISEELKYVYTVLEPENVTKALSIRLPHPKLRQANHDPYTVTVAPILKNSQYPLVINESATINGRELAGNWNEWHETDADFIKFKYKTTLDTDTHRVRTDLDELLPSGIGIENETKTSAKLFSLCPEVDYSTSSCEDKDPVLFIHGYSKGGKFSGGSDYWGNLPELLKNQGFAVFEFTWRTNTRYVDAANDLASMISRINQKSRKKVHVIAHSFGGLLARTYLQSYAQMKTKNRKYEDNVQSLITIGTPHSGIFDSNNNDRGFPKGQDDTSFEACTQISCNQAGEHTPDSWIFGFHNYSDYFLQNPEKNGAGELVSKLDMTKEDLPVDTLVLMGLLITQPLELGGYKYRSGDALISFAGQRFDKSWKESVVQPVKTLDSGKTLTEKIMGFSGLDTNAAPTEFVPQSVIDKMSDPNKPFTGYRHSSSAFFRVANPIKTNGSTPEANVEDTNDIPGFNCESELDNSCPHAAYSEIKKWLAIHTSQSKLVSEISLTVTVKNAITNADLPDAQVEILMDDGDSAIDTTNTNGHVSINVPFQKNTPYTAIVSADGYRSEEHTTGYMTSATIAGSSTDFGTIYLQSDNLQTGSLGGQVTDSDTGLPISNVNFKMRRYTILVQGTTDVNGNYNKDNLIRGNWQVTFAKQGYISKTYYFTVVPGSTLANATLSSRKPILNDTGITFGGSYPLGNNITCTGETISQQDCSHGRDATHNDNIDGHAGFSFTKLDANGNSLAATASSWSCVKDNVTGLIWEVKTDDSGIHNKDNTYRWGGITHEGSNYGAYDDDWDTLVNGSNSGGGLCGFTDWRVPSISELESLVNLNQFNPAIDTAYFPNTPASYFWSASPNANYSGIAWIVVFNYGNSRYYGRSGNAHVRLVRSGQ